MDANDRVKMAIGNMVVQIEMLNAELEKALARVKELENPSMESSDQNIEHLPKPRQTGPGRFDKAPVGEKA